MPIDLKTQVQSTQSKSSSSSSSMSTNSTPITSTTSKQSEWFKKKTETALKKVNRLEEKFNQAIGKASRTEDDQFESYSIKFEQQHLASNLVQKELQKYLNSLKEAQKNSKNFYESLKQVYEPTWPSYNDLIQNCQLQEKYWNDLLANLNANISQQINEYNKEFPEYRKLIEKRDNKLLDYDKARHTFDDLQTKNNYDDAKLNKIRLDLKEKQRLYDDLNMKLNDELPKLYDSRVSVYGSLFKQLFMQEKRFHQNMSNTKLNMEQIFDSLNQIANTNHTTDFQHNKVNKNIDDVYNEAESDGDYQDELIRNPDNSNKLPNLNQNQNESIESTKLQNKCLYRVKATYPYEAKEVDELEFSKDDLIDVVECTESEKEDMDEGWLIGIHLTSKKRGLFPENFTKRV
jgi:amphiphysin